MPGPDTSPGTRPSHVLLVLDDEHAAWAAEDEWRAAGTQTSREAIGTDALIAVSRGIPDAVVAAARRPVMSGFELVRHIRATGASLPVILLVDDTADRDRAIDSGADAGLPRTTPAGEIAAVLAALLHSPEPGDAPTDGFGDVAIGPDPRRVTVAGQPIPLSRTEVLVLRRLIAVQGIPQPAAALLAAVWGPEQSDANLVHQYVSSLRRKLTAAGSAVTIETRRGAGYLLADGGADRAAATAADRAEAG